MCHSSFSIRNNSQDFHHIIHKLSLFLLSTSNRYTIPCTKRPLPHLRIGVRRKARQGFRTTAQIRLYLFPIPERIDRPALRGDPPRPIISPGIPLHRLLEHLAHRIHAPLPHKKHQPSQTDALHKYLLSLPETICCFSSCPSRQMPGYPSRQA